MNFHTYMPEEYHPNATPVGREESVQGLININPRVLRTDGGTTEMGDAGPPELSGEELRRLQWQTQHTTISSQYFQDTPVSNDISDELPFWTARTMTSLRLLDVSWTRYGNPTSDDINTGAWQYTFLLTSDAWAVTPYYFLPRQENDPIPDNVGFVPHHYRIKPDDIYPDSEKKTIEGNTGFTDFLKVQSSDEYGEAEDVAVSARRDPDLYGFSNTEDLIEKFIKEKDSENVKNLRFKLRQALSEKRGEPFDLANPSSAFVETTHPATSNKKDTTALISIATTLAGFSSAGFGAFWGGVTIIKSLLELFNQETGDLAYYEGFKMSDPGENRPVSGFYVMFDAYVGPNNKASIEVESRHEFIRHEFSSSGGSLAKVNPTWYVQFDAPPAPPKASIEDLFESASPTSEFKNENVDTVLGPVPAINYPGLNDEEWTPVVGDAIEFDAYDTVLHGSEIDQYLWKLFDNDIRGRDRGPISEKEGKKVSFEFNNPHNYTVRLRVDDEGTSGRNSVSFDVSYPHSIVIEGIESSSGATYEFTVTGELQKHDGTLDINGEQIEYSVNESDEVNKRSAEGFVRGGADGYLYSGELDSLTVVPPGNATVYVDGQERPPDYPHTLVISGTEGGTRAKYKIRVTEDIRGYNGKLPAGDGMIGVGLNEPDKVAKRSAEGTVTAGADGYLFAGSIDSLTVEPPQEGIVYIDGEERSPDYPHTLVISGTEGGTRAEYGIEVTEGIRGYDGKLPAGDGTIEVGLNEPDKVAERSAEGTVTEGADGYLFAGDIKSLIVEPPEEATVYVDGEQRPVDDGGNKPPTAEFNVSPQSPSPGEDITFDASEALDPDGNIWEYAWEFIEKPNQDPFETASGKTVTKAFSSGTYAIHLTVTDDDGASATTSTTLKVGNQPPTASFDANPRNPSLNEAVTFDAGQSTDPDGTIAGYEWEIVNTDGPDESLVETATGQLFTHTFTEPGTYAVRLAVTDNNGATGTSTLEISLEDGGPVAKIEAPDDPVPVDQEVTVSGEPSVDPDGQISQYNWTLEQDGQSLTFTGKTFTHQFSESAAYTVRLTVVNSDNVSASTTTEITVGDVPVARFEMRPDSSPVAHEDVTFDATKSTDPDGSISSYEWEFREKPSQNPERASGATVTRSFPAGTYAVTLTVRDQEGFSASMSKTLHVNQSPTAQFDISPESPTVDQEITFDAGASRDPDGSIETYDWEFREKDTQPVETASGKTITRSLASGEYTISLTVTDDDGATHTSSRPLSIAPPPIAPTARFDISPASPTADQTVTFDASGSKDPDGSIETYEWAFREKGDQNPERFSGKTARWSFSPGEYAVTLTVTDDAGQTDRTTKPLHVAPPPEPPAAQFNISDDSPAPDETVVFDASRSTDPDGSIASYEWAIYRMKSGQIDTEPVANMTGQTATYSFADSITYAVELTVTDDSGATDTTSKDVSVNRPPKAAFEMRPSSPDSSDEVTFDASGSKDPDGSIETYEWAFREKGDQNPERLSGKTVTWSFSPGEYAVTLTVTDNDGAMTTKSKGLTVGETN